jgi:predicted porin
LSRALILTINHGPFAAVKWQTTRALTLTGNAYLDHMSNAAIAIRSRRGLSMCCRKRTEVYGTVDFDKILGTAPVESPGKSNQTGVALGLRTIFQVTYVPQIHQARDI